MKNNYFVYFVASFFALLVQYLCFPTLFTYTEPFQDGGINFLQIFLNENLLSSLTKQDAAYWPLASRVIFEFTSLFLPITLIPHVVSIIVIVTISLSTATLMFPVWKKTISSDVVRFCLVIAIVLWPDFESHKIENLGIWLFIPIMTLLWGAKNKFTVIPLALIAFICEVSKPVVLGVGLVAAYSVFVLIYKKQKLNYINLSIPIALAFGLFAQVTYSLYQNQVLKLWTPKNWSEILSFLGKQILFLPGQLLESLSPFRFSGLNIFLALFLVGLLAIFILRRFAKTGKKSFLLYLLDESNYLTVSLSIVFVSSLFIVGYVYGSAEHWLESPFEKSRHYFVSITSLLIIFIALIEKVIVSLGVKRTYAIILQLLFIVMSMLSSLREGIQEPKRWSDWASFSKYIGVTREPTNFVAPIDSYSGNWILTTGPKYLGTNSQYDSIHSSDYSIGDNSWCIESSDQEIVITHLFIKDGGNFEVKLHDDKQQTLIMDQIQTNLADYTFFKTEGFVGRKISISILGETINSDALLLIGYGSPNKCR